MRWLRCAHRTSGTDRWVLGARVSRADDRGTLISFPSYGNVVLCHLARAVRPAPENYAVIIRVQCEVIVGLTTCGTFIGEIVWTAPFKVIG
jgi:hypothetical protein